MGSWFAYILKSLKDGKYYTGSTSDIAKRLEQHNAGLNKSTRGRGPFVVVYREKYPTRGEAFGREMQIKRYRSGDAFKNLLQR